MPKIVKEGELFHAVMQVIAARGYAGATTKAMAKEANVSEVTLFRKFGSKQELVKQAISSIIKNSALASSAQYTGDLESDLARILIAYQASAIEHGDFISAVFLELSRNPELVEVIDEPMNAFLAIGDIIAKYQEEGKLKKGAPIQFLAVLFGPLMYTAMMQRALPIPNQTSLDLSTYLDNFISGYKPGPGDELKTSNPVARDRLSG